MLNRHSTAAEDAGIPKTFFATSNILEDKVSHLHEDHPGTFVIESASANRPYIFNNLEYLLPKSSVAWSACLLDLHLNQDLG